MLIRNCHITIRTKSPMLYLITITILHKTFTIIIVTTPPFTPLPTSLKPITYSH